MHSRFSHYILRAFYFINDLYFVHCRKEYTYVPYNYAAYGAISIGDLRKKNIEDGKKVNNVRKSTCYDRSILRNRAFIATITVLKDINIAPTAGDMIQSNRRPVARGIAITLYPVAQKRF